VINSIVKSAENPSMYFRFMNDKKIEHISMTFIGIKCDIIFHKVVYENEGFDIEILSPKLSNEDLINKLKN